MGSSQSEKRDANCQVAKECEMNEWTGSTRTVDKEYKPESVHSERVRTQ